MRASCTPATGCRATCLLRPRSRGSVTLNSADPLAAPRIDPAFFDDPRDLDDMVAGFRLTRRLMEAPALAGWTTRDLFTANVNTDDEIRDVLRRRTDTVYHPVGTCRMGHDALAVVDPQLRVRGLQAAIVDASVMPTLIGGNQRTDDHDRREGHRPDAGRVPHIRTAATRNRQDDDGSRHSSCRECRARCHPARGNPPCCRLILLAPPAPPHRLRRSSSAPASPVSAWRSRCNVPASTTSRSSNARTTWAACARQPLPGRRLRRALAPVLVLVRQSGVVARVRAAAEIHAYLQHCARKYGLARYLRFGAEVAHARYDEAAALGASRSPTARRSAPPCSSAAPGS